MSVKSRPSRLLNLNKSSATNRALSATNSTTSPLLRLPSEIRSRIWEYVLGGNVIHIVQGKHNTTFATICEHVHEYDNISDLCHGYDLNIAATLRNTHDSCSKGRTLPRILTVTLLMTCRQIYHEAALCPFAKNCFVASDSNGHYGDCLPVLSSFLNQKINPTQARAIQHLILKKHSIFWGDFTTSGIWARLSGLKTLAVIVKFELWPYPMAVANTPYGDIVLEPSKKLRYSSVQVGVEFDSSPFELLGGSMDASTVRDVRAWQRRMEDALLGLRGEAVATEKMQQKARLAKEEAEQEKRDKVRRAHGLRKL